MFFVVAMATGVFLGGARDPKRTHFEAKNRDGDILHKNRKSMTMELYT